MTHNSVLHTWQLAGSAVRRDQRALNTLTVNLKNDLYDESSFIQLSTEYTLRGWSNCFPAEHHSFYYHEITAEVWNITSCTLDISDTLRSLKSTTAVWNCLQCAPGNSAKSQSHSSSSSPTLIQSPVETLLLTHPTFFVVSYSNSASFHTKQTAVRRVI